MRLLRRDLIILAALAGALAGAACSDQAPAGAEDVRVTLQQSASASAQAVGWFASAHGFAADGAAIDRDTVASLVVRVTEIQFLPKDQEADADNDGAWISLSLATPVLIDLMTLPTEGASPLVIAAGSVPVGAYGDVRLFTDSAAIQFKGPIALSVAFSFEGGVDYEVTTPSGPETGIKTNAEFTVEADAEGNLNDVNLLFDPDATFLNVTGTGTGQVILAPVIRGPGGDAS